MDKERANGLDEEEYNVQVDQILMSSDDDTDDTAAYKRAEATKRRRVPAGAEAATLPAVGPPTVSPATATPASQPAAADVTDAPRELATTAEEQSSVEHPLAEPSSGRELALAPVVGDPSSKESVLCVPGQKGVGNLFVSVSCVLPEGTALCHLKSFRVANGVVTVSLDQPDPRKRTSRGETERKPNMHNLTVEAWPAPFPSFDVVYLCKVRLYKDAAKQHPRDVCGVYRDSRGKHPKYELKPGSVPPTGHFHAQLVAPPVAFATIGGDADAHDGKLFALLCATVPGVDPAVRFVRGEAGGQARRWMRSVGGTVVYKVSPRVTPPPANVAGDVTTKLDVTLVAFKLLWAHASVEVRVQLASYLVVSMGHSPLSFGAKSVKVNGVVFQFPVGSSHRLATDGRLKTLLEDFSRCGDLAIPDTPPCDELSVRQPDLHALLAQAAKLLSGRDPFCPLTDIVHAARLDGFRFRGGTKITKRENPGCDVGIMAAWRPNALVPDYEPTAEETAALDAYNAASTTGEAERTTGAEYEALRKASDIHGPFEHGIRRVVSVTGTFRAGRDHYVGLDNGGLWHVAVPHPNKWWEVHSDARDGFVAKYSAFKPEVHYKTYLDGAVSRPAFAVDPVYGAQLPLRFLETFTNTIGVAYALAEDEWSEDDLRRLASAAHVVGWMHKEGTPEDAQKSFAERMQRFVKPRKLGAR